MTSSFSILLAFHGGFFAMSFRGSLHYLPSSHQTMVERPKPVRGTQCSGAGGVRYFAADATSFWLLAASRIAPGYRGIVKQWFRRSQGGQPRKQHNDDWMGHAGRNAAESSDNVCRSLVSWQETRNPDSRDG